MAETDLPASRKILVLCIDRDGDLEAKIGVNGPIVGREKILEAAMKLGVADPTESDTNVLFAGIKIAEGLKDSHRDVEVVALTGTKKVGVESDLIISKQLDKVLKKLPIDGVVLVSDGAEDEHVLPIVESRAKVLSLQRVVVKQSEPLESTYYILLDFLKEVTSDPKLARLVLGVPGIAFVLYMILDIVAWRVIFGVVGILLVIKGFNLEEPLERNIVSLRESLVTDKASFFTYIIAAIVGIIGVLRGYQAVGDLNSTSYIDAIPLFISLSKDPLVAAGLLALAGRSIDAIIEGRGLGKYLMLAIFLVSLWFIVGAISSFSLRVITIAELVGRATIGAALSLAAFLLRRATFKEQ
jgi:putative membrane protein